MKQIVRLWIGAAILMLSSCGKENFKPFDTPFIHIMENNTASATVNYQANVIRSYNVYLSSRPLTENLSVTYEIVPGSGLRENVDYEVLTKENPLVFLPGIYDMPVRVRWLPSPDFNPQADNTLTIRLVSNDKGYTLGLPGPDQRQKEFIITKIQ